MSIWTQKSALIQLRTSLLKFDDLAEKSEKSSVSNFSTKVWSDDPNGFPHPDGCYLRIDETAGTEAAVLYELYVIFSPKNGLRAEKRYQVVMNAISGPLLSEEEPGNGAVHIWSMDDAFENPFAVVEFA